MEKLAVYCAQNPLKVIFSWLLIFTLSIYLNFSFLEDGLTTEFTFITDPVNAYVISEGEAWVVALRTATNAVDQRSKIIDEVNALRDNSLDYYAAVRSSYYQNRKAAIANNDDQGQTPMPLISIEFE